MKRPKKPADRPILSMKTLLARAVRLIMTVWIMSALLFALLTAMPGNALDGTLAAQHGVRAADAPRARRTLGLDQPWYAQYVRWLVGHYGVRWAPRYVGPETASA